MFKYIFSFILAIIVVIEALSASADKIEIKAVNIESKNDTITAKDNVVVYYENSIIKASSATYNKTTKLLVLDGDIEMIGYKNSKEQSNHMEIHTDTSEVTFEELFYVSENDVWIFSDTAHKVNGDYTFGTSLLSSCDISDPLWKMIFSDASYDSDANYMKIYNAKVYLWDVPIFYSPYLAFSTHKQRSSGLLFPGLGYTESEGLLYEQPIFWAISDSMDLEINPQIRTLRSQGIYSTFRFVDSNHSSGSLRVGYFKDMESYTQEHNLINSSHYGFDFNYESSDMFSALMPKGFVDGLYIDTTYLNDVDYLNLQTAAQARFGINPVQESRINYFAHDNDYYAGINAKYFIDTRRAENDTTLQILPSVQLHKYLDSIIVNNLTYSADFHINNFDRIKGATMSQGELKIPLDYTTAFFDDFLNVSIGEDFYYSKYFFGNGDFVYDDFSYYSNLHKLKFFTDLTKKYNHFTHVMQTAVAYSKPGVEQQSPIEFSLLSLEQKELFTVGLPEEKYDFSLSQYFYDEDMKLTFFQRLSQKYYVEREYELADISNEMQYNWEDVTLYSNITYAYEFSTIRDASSYISLNQADYRVSLGHSYQEVLPDLPITRPLNDVNLLFAYTYNEKIKFSGGVTYNLDESTSRQWAFGGSYTRDCWSVNASIREEIRPTTVGPVTLSTFFMQLNFTPFGSIGTGDLQ